MRQRVKLMAPISFAWILFLLSAGMTPSRALAAPDTESNSDSGIEINGAGDLGVKVVAHSGSTGVLTGARTVIYFLDNFFAGSAGYGSAIFGNNGTFGYGGITAGYRLNLGQTFFAEGELLFGGGGGDMPDPSAAADDDEEDEEESTDETTGGSVALEFTAAIGAKIGKAGRMSFAMGYLIMPGVEGFSGLSFSARFGFGF